MFALTVSNTSTATPGVDFELSDANITITPDIAEEEFMACVYLTIIGDTYVEDDELIVIEVTSLAEQDRVYGSNYIRAMIIDNDGTA